MYTIMLSGLLNNISTLYPLASLQSTVQIVLEVLIGWFEEHDFVPQLVSSSPNIHFVASGCFMITQLCGMISMCDCGLFFFFAIGSLAVCLVGLPGEAPAAWSPLVHSTAGQEMCSAP